MELPAEALPPTSRMRPGLGEGPGHLAGRERRYLGCVRLPLSAIYQTGVLEGTFKVGSAPWRRLLLELAAARPPGLGSR